MPTDKDFSKEKWKEIYDTRERLEAYRLKIQPYPYQEPEKVLLPEQVIVHRHINYTANMSKEASSLLHQIDLRTKYLYKKVATTNRKPEHD